MLLRRKKFRGVKLLDTTQECFLSNLQQCLVFSPGFCSINVELVQFNLVLSYNLVIEKELVSTIKSNSIRI